MAHKIPYPRYRCISKSVFSTRTVRLKQAQDDRLVCTPNGHLYRVTYIRCHINTINSPDDGHVAARNMQRIEIDIHEKELCVKLFIYKDKICLNRNKK
jgi:hypothetical protein